MIITVTQQMIAAGQRCVAENCPLALAFAAVGFDVLVGPFDVDFYAPAGDLLGTLPLPPVAQSWQKRFDDGRSAVEPLEFDMPQLTIPGVFPARLALPFRSVAVV